MSKIQTKPAHSTNPCDLAELDLFSTQARSDTDFAIGAQLRFGPELLNHTNGNKLLEVHISRAVLKLHTSGCTVSQVGKYADIPRPRSIVTTIEQDDSTQVSAEASAGGEVGVDISPSPSMPTFKANASGSLRNTRSSTQHSSRKIEREIHSWQCLPNNRWEIKDIEEDFLRGNYTPHETLCNINIKETSGHVKASVQLLPYDIVITYKAAPSSVLDKARNLLTANKEAIAKAIISKSLSSLNGTKRSGEFVTLSESVIEYKVEEDERT